MRSTSHHPLLFWTVGDDGHGRRIINDAGRYAGKGGVRDVGKGRVIGRFGSEEEGGRLGVGQGSW